MSNTLFAGTASSTMMDASIICVSDLLAFFDREEIWRPVKDYPGYFVSSWARVRGPRRMLASVLTGGYAVVSLSRGPAKKIARVHILVADAFLGPAPFDGALVAHNDGHSEISRVRNLRWASSRENQADRGRHGTRTRGSRVHGAKLVEADIPLIRVRLAAGERYPAIAKDFGVSKHTIYLIKHNRIWRHAGGAAWGVNQGATP